MTEQVLDVPIRAMAGGLPPGPRHVLIEQLGHGDVRVGLPPGLGHREQLTRLGVPAVTLPGLGHNAHVEDPQLASTLLDPHRYAVGRGDRRRPSPRVDGPDDPAEHP